MSIFTLTTTGKIKKVLEDGVLYCKKVPKWLNDTKLEEYFKIHNHGIKTCKVIFIEDENKQVEMLKIFNVLKEAGFENLIPVINKKKKKLLAVLLKKDLFFYYLPEKGLNCYIRLFGYFVKFAQKLFEHNITFKIKDGCNNLFRFYFGIRPDALLAYTITVLYENYTEVLNFDGLEPIDYQEQEYYVSNSFINLLMSDRKISIPLLPEPILDYFRKIRISKENSIGFDKILEILNENSNVVDKNDDILIDSSELLDERYIISTVSTTDIGEIKKIQGQDTRVFMFSENLSSLKIDEYIKKIKYIKALNVTIKGNFIRIYDFNKFQTVGYVYPHSDEIFSNVFEHLQKIYIMLNESQYVLDISKIEVENFVFIKQYIYGSVPFRRVRENSDGYFYDKLLNNNYNIYYNSYEPVIDNHNNIILSGENNNTNVNQEIIKLLFDYIKLLTDKFNKEYIRLFPPKVIEYYNDYIKNNCTLNYNKKQAEDILQYLAEVLWSKSEDGDYYSRYAAPPLKVKPFFVSKKEEINLPGYKFFSCTKNRAREMFLDISKIQDIDFPSMDYIVYEVRDRFEFVVKGILYKNTTNKYKKISSILKKDSFITSNIGYLILFRRMMDFIQTNRLKTIATNLGFDEKTRTLGINEFWDEEIKAKHFMRPIYLGLYEYAQKLKGYIPIYDELYEEMKAGFEKLKENWGSLSLKLEAFENVCTSYCKEHDLYYSNQLPICPICSKENIFVEDSSLQTVEARIEEFYKDEDEKVGYFLFDEITDKEWNEANKNYKKTMEFCDSICVNIDTIIKKVSNGNIIGYTYVITGRPITLSEYLSNKEKLAIVHKFRQFAYRGITEGSLVGRLNYFDFNEHTDLLRDFYVCKVGNSDFDYVIRVKDIFSLNTAMGTYYEKTANLRKSILSFLGDSVSKEERQYAINLTSDNLKLYIEQLTDYCKVHNCWSYSHTSCKLCESDKLEYVTFSVYDKNTELKGGEARVYQYEEGYKIKVWKPEKIILNQKYETLKRLKAKNLKAIPYEDYKLKLIKPLKFAKVKYTEEEAAQFGGYVMEEVVDGKALRLLEDIKIVEELQFSTVDVLEMLIAFGMGLNYIHENNACVGDLSGNNLLFDKNKWIYVLDIDSFGVDELGSTTYTPHYTDPLVVTLDKQVTTSKTSDYYAFAILSFLLLTHIHPFKGVYYEDGNKVMMAVEERMKKKLSVLGNHDIKLPRHISVEKAWKGWMSSRLQEAFLSIFEKEERFNIVDILKEEYNRLSGDIKEDKKTSDISTEVKEPIVQTIPQYDTNVLITENDRAAEELIKNPDAKLSYKLTSRNRAFLTSYNKGMSILITFTVKPDLYKDICNLSLSPSYCDLFFDFGYCNDKKMYAISYYENIPSKRRLLICDEVYNVIADLYTFSSRMFDILYDQRLQQFIFIFDDAIYIWNQEFPNIKKLDLVNVEEEILKKKNYCFYNNSLYFPLDGKILAVNIVNSSKKEFLVEGLKSEETIRLVKTREGFKAITKYSTLSITPDTNKNTS